MAITTSSDTAQRLKARLQRILGAILWIRFVWLLPWLVGATVQAHRDVMVTPYAPYALFNASFSRLFGLVGAALAALWLLWLVTATRAARSP